MLQKKLPFILLFIFGISQNKIIAKFLDNSKNNIYYIDKKNKISNEIKKDINNEKNSINKLINFLASEVESKELNSKDQIEGLEIISDTKLINGDFFSVKGNVIARKNNAVLKADELTYDSKKNIIYIKGNIEFKIQDQYLISSEIRYDFKSKKGYILESYGSINFDTLGSIELDNKKFKKIDFKEKEKFIRNVTSNNSNNLGFSSKKVELELNEIQKWRFQAKKIEIDNDNWFSKELFLTNDPYNKPQVIIKNQNFQVNNKSKEIVIKTKWSSLVIEDKLSIPLGPRKIKVGELKSLKWGLGYDQNNKDGLFLIRSADPIYFGNKKIKLDLNNEFYLQRALIGKTKSFNNKNDSIYANKIEQDNNLSDLFGINTNLSTKFYGFDLNSELALNSLDINKFNNILTSKNTLEKILYEEKKENSSKATKLTLFSNYRENIWNGSLGEKEILSASGLRIGKKNDWIYNDVDKSSTIALGYGTYQSNKKNNIKENIVKDRLNILLERKHSYPIWKPKKDNYISQDYMYTPAVIQKGIYLNANAQVDLYRYSDGNFQDLYTFKIGPEITLGNFKKKYLDFSQFSIYPKFTLSEGESPFDFDQAIDNHLIEISYKQQLVGALSLKISTDYNLDINSKNYKKFTNNIYEIALNRRAYNLSAYYNQQTESGGINFKIYSFNFDGLGDKFN